MNPYFVARISHKVHGMQRLAILSACVACVPLAAQAQIPASPVLTGKISSAQERIMEGVLVTAKRADSPVRVTVVSDATGRYSFPAGRLEPGKYSLAIRAVGYDLNTAADVEIKSRKTTTANLQLGKTKDLAAQLTNAEWMVSMGGPVEKKIDLIDCTGCHSVERVMRSGHNAESFGKTLQRMSNYSFVSFWLKPQLRPGTGPNIGEGGPGVPERFKPLSEYLSTINQGSKTHWDYPLKTFDRPKGAATKVIITSFDLPRRVIQPHDVILDAQGMAWYSNFGEQTIGRVDPATGAHKEWKIPSSKPNAPEGTLDLEIDAEGNFWIAMMHQGSVARFDPKTEQFRIYDIPAEWNNDNVRVSMLTAPKAGSKFMWILNQGVNDILRMNIDTGAMERFQPLKLLPAGRPRAIYGIETDADDNLYFTEFLSHYFGRIDAKTGEIKFFELPTKNSWPRRLKADAQGRFWMGEWHGGKVAMFDPKTEKFSEYGVTTPFSGMYDAIADKNGEVWSGGMTTDRIARINPQTGTSIEYLMPDNTNVRRVFVDNRSGPVKFWVGSNHGAALVRVEPLE